MSKNTENLIHIVLNCSKISDSEIPELLTKIDEILVEGGSHNAGMYDNNHWNWQYKQLPNQLANVYVIKDGENIIGYYHVPIYHMQVNGASKKFAMVQDVATSAKYRGKGIFRQLAEYATNDLLNVSKVDGIYTFPNDKSIHTFLKYNNYEQVVAYSSYIFPVNGKAILNSKIKLPLINDLLGWCLSQYAILKSAKPSSSDEIKVDQNISDEVAGLYLNYSKQHKVSLARNEDYLNWRFFKKPGATHYCLSYYANKKLTASIICKPDRILGVNALLILDFAFTENHDNAISKLVHYAGQQSNQIFKNEIALVFTSFANPHFLKTKRFGFIKVPDKINPRVLKLLVNKSTTETEALQANNWHATLADWDVL